VSELVRLEGVAKTFAGDGEASGATVLRGVDLVLEAGSTTAVLGPSGSGKSTLLNVLGTLEPPSEGRVLWEGTDLATLAPDDLARFRNRSIGFVFQHHHLLPQCTALENVLVPTLASGRPDAGAEKRAVDLLERVGLGHRHGHRPAQLSGGERQRVAVVRALINGPRLLLADEPTGSLDATSADALGELLLELNEHEGVALVLVTHAPKLGQRMRKVYELADGKLSEAPRESR
jgi:ABC-type lipoprotein export system ATPase subunit